MYSTPIGAIACLAAACALTASGAAHAQTPDPKLQREALLRALETLLATGDPEHATHDTGEWLQLAVDDAIVRGDIGVERIAIRAASPLTARIDSPVSATASPPFLELNSLTVLKLPRPLAYAARVFASLDGSEFVQMPDQVSGKRGGFRVDRLGVAAVQPGFHHVRVRAHLTFGDSAEPTWTEVRDLPQVFYALYDADARSENDARRFIHSPAAVPVREFDPLLGDEPFGGWLTTVLSKHGARRDSPPHWSSQYCSERTAEAGLRPIPTAICSLVHFGVENEIGQIWFRTAEIRTTDNGVEWVTASPPQFEGLVLLRGAPESQRLSALPLLLDTVPALRPTGDVAIAPDDILITPHNPKPGLPAAVTVTVRNQGQGDLHKALVYVAFGSTVTARGQTRQFVVDLPAQSSVEITLDAVFPQGFGFVMAHAMQIGEHAPQDSWNPDPTPEDACAFRIVNPRAAPPRYAESLRDQAGSCPGK
jgi:hypothetical protein